MPGTVLLMQNVDLGHTKVIKIHQREALSHQGAIIHENCCSAAQWPLLDILLNAETFPRYRTVFILKVILCRDNLMKKMPSTVYNFFDQRNYLDIFQKKLLRSLNSQYF